MGRSILQQVKPRSTFDLCSLIYALVLIHAEVLFGEFMVLPWLINNHNIGLFKICCLQVYGAFLYFNVIGNIWKIMITNTSTVGKVLPTLLKPGKKQINTSCRISFLYSQPLIFNFWIFYGSSIIW